jgi:hypothetical protein
MRRLLFAALAVFGGVVVILPVTGRAAGGNPPQAFFRPDTPKFPQARTWVAQKAKLPPYKAPRTPDGVPDLQGNWNGPVGGGNDDLEEHEYVDVTTPPQESYVSDPSDGKVPYTAWALAKRNEIRAGLARGWPGETGQRLYSDPSSLCLNGMPRLGFGGQEIIQKPGLVILLTANTYRVIPTDGRAHMASDAKFYFGNSRGRWDGETLVVDITGLNGETWLDSAGNFYGPNTHMVERWTRVEPNTIDYVITIEDPAIYTRPWTMTYPKRRTGTGPGANPGSTNAVGAAGVVPAADPYAKEIWEQTCLEGNRDNVVLLNKLGFKWFDAVTPPR